MVSQPRKQHPVLVGHKRANLIEIERKTGCQVELPPAEAQSDQITIRGPDSGLIAALNLVMELVNSSSCEEIPLAPPSALLYLARSARDRLQALEGGLVSISVSPSSVDILGSRDNVAAVRPKVVELVNQYKALAYADLTIPSDIVKMVLGKDNKNVTASKKNFDVEVFSVQEGGAHKVVLAGPKDKMRGAFTFFQTLIKELVDLPSVDVQIAAPYQAGIGRSISEILAKHEKAIIVAKPDEGIVTVRAPKNEHQAIAAVLLAHAEAQRLHEEAHSHTAEVKVDTKVAKHLIGKNEVALNRVREQTETKIDVLRGEQKAEREAKLKGASTDAKAPAAAPAKGKKAAAATTEEKPAEYEWFFIKGTKEGVNAAAKIIKERAREILEGGGMTTEEFKVDRRFHGVLIGAKGANLRSLNARHNVNVQFPGNDSESDMITITGIKSAVLKAKAELLELLDFEKSRRYQETVELDKSFVKSTLKDGNGRSGALIQIAQEANVKIDLTESGDGVLVTGEKPAVAKAAKALKELQHVKLNSVTVELALPRKVYPALIGPKGSRIQEFQAAHPGVQVKFPETGEPDIVRVTGLAAAVKTAEADLRKAAEERYEERLEVEPPADLAAIRSIVREIGDKHGVRIFLPRSTDTKQTIVILGKPAACQAAHAEIAALEVAAETGELPVYARGQVLSNGELRDLCTALKVRLACPPQDDQTETYTLSGVASDVAAAKDQVAESVKAIVARAASSAAASAANASLKVRQTVTVPQSKQGTVIGKGGETVKKIQSDHNVRVDIKRGSDTVHIRGATDEEVAAAIAAIEKLVFEFRVAVDPIHFAYIIGPEGSRLRQFQDAHDVQLRIPKDHREAFVSVRPRSDAVDLEAVKAALLELVELHDKEFAARNAEPEREATPEPEQDLEEGEIPPSPARPLFYVSASAPAVRVAGAWANTPSFNK